MFAISDSRVTRNCQQVSRRELLQVGGLGMAGLSLPQLLAAKARAAAAGSVVKDKAIVLLFLQGGPSHIELFDPKMTAPVEFRSTTGEVTTRLPGVTFGGTFPRLAAMADRLAVVRSFASGNSGHTYLSVSGGGNRLKATMGSIYSRVTGTNHPKTGMPTNAIILPEAIRDDLKLRKNFETNALPTLMTAGELGSNYAAFNPTGGGDLKQNLKLQIKRGRLDDRRALLRSLDRLKRQADADGLLKDADEFQQQAFDVLTRGIADAFDLSKEDPRTIARYDTSKLFRMEELNKYNDMYRSSNLLGKQLLLARRLCEAGCGFVTVGDAGWDMHGNRNSLPRLTGIVPLGQQVDHAVAAFLQDIEERGLSDRILLIITGEMGRTPRINGRGGRDHYGGLTSLVFAGGGLKMGQVIGRSDQHATKPASEPLSPKHLLATVMNTLFDLGELRLEQSVPRDILQVAAAGQPIRQLL